MVLDDDLRVVELCPGAGTILAAERNAVVGRPFGDLFLADPTRLDDEETLRAVLGPTDGEEPVPVRCLRLRRATGGEPSVEASVSRLRLGGVTLLAVMVRDLSARRTLDRLQAVLMETGAIFARSLGASETVGAIARVAANHLADWCIVYLTDDDGAVCRLEVACRDPADDGLAEALRAAPLPDVPVYPVARVLETGEPQVVPRAPRSSLTIEDPRPGVAREAALEATSYLLVPLRHGADVMGVLALISTDPERRYDGRDLAPAQELARRTALALEGARLYDTARRAVTTRDEVLGMVSHDLGTQVSSMVMILNRLLGRVPPEEDRRTTRRYLESMRSSVAQMRRLIEDLLDVREIETGHFSVQPEPVSLRDLIELALDEIAPLSDAEGAAVEVSLPSEDLVVEADRDRVLQVLWNLVSNAVRHGSPADSPVVISARREGDAVAVSVTDRGPGIRPEHLPTLFDRFAQARRASRGGAGLGLTISREIVEAHGGRIEVDTEVGVGSTFRFTLPLARSASSVG